MKYLTVKNPIWCSAEKNQINCIVEFDSIGEVPFTACSNDIYGHSKEIFERCIFGEFGFIGDYVPPPVPEIVGPV